jgi:hypothetical protein
MKSKLIINLILSGLTVGFILVPSSLKSLSLFRGGNMSIDPKQFRELIVKPALIEGEQRGFKGFNSPEAEELLMLTAAQETHMGRWLRQRGTDGHYAPGRGVYSMELDTFSWLWSKHPDLDDLLSPYPERLVWDLKLATKFARLRYWIVKDALPKATDIKAMAEYWDQWYNGNPNVGFPKDAVANYKRFVLEEKP